MVAEQTGTPPHSQVKLSGIIPPLADSFHQRPETGLYLRAGLYPGDTVVLTHGEDTDAAPAAQGGTGKTQLAVAFTHALWGARAVDALVWVPATSQDAIITGFAQAAVTVGAAEVAMSAETAADRFIGWLARTRRRWALILDDLVRPADLENLWPAGPAGQVVITTRLPEAVFGGGPGPAPGGAAGPRIAPVGGFSRREVLAYLGARLTDYPDQRGDALDLGEDLGGLPLGLAQAAAVMTVDQLSYREYRGRFGERREHMSAMRIDGVSPAVLATWSLAAECAHQLPPAGVAWPALALAAMLDPDGIPGAVLTSPAGCGYIAGRPSAGEAADQRMVHAAMTNLARVGLVSVDPASPARTVRMHASVQAAVRAYLPPADFEQAVLAAAEALMQAWPEAGRTQDPLEQAQLEQVLRDCAGALWAADGAVPRPAEGGQHARPVPLSAAGAQAYQVARPHQSRLWQPEAHPVLFRKGISLEASGLAGSAITYWQTMLITSTRLLGNAHANAVRARDRLGVAYEAAGRSGDAITVFNNALADGEHNSGPEHPDTIAARASLAFAYHSAGQLRAAIPAYERALADSERVRGPDHADTRSARTHLAAAYQQAGRLSDAIDHYEQALADSERMLGPGDVETLTIRSSLAAAVIADKRPTEAVPLLQRTLADAERYLGPDHPMTRTVRENLEAATRA